MKKTGIGTNIILGLVFFIGICTVGYIAVKEYRDSRNPSVIAERIKEAKASAKKIEAINAEDKKEAEASAWRSKFDADVAVQNMKYKAEQEAIKHDYLNEIQSVTVYVIENLRDPQSFSAAKAIYMVDTGDIFMIYRARNGFGGMNVGYAYSNKAKNTVALDEDIFIRKLKKAKGMRIDVTSYANIVSRIAE